MAPPQGLIYWGGVADLISGQFTLAPGVTPSTCTLRIPPQDASRIFSAGPLVVRYGSAAWRFERCRVDTLAEVRGSDGRTIWELSIFDRRWLWLDCGRISGFYNARSGSTIKHGTEKTPRELAELCLKAMGETRFDVSALPNDTRPETDWDYARPAAALAEICDPLGCVVVLGLDDRVRIARKGIGLPLPTAGIIDGSQVADPPDPPGRIVVVGGRTRYQADFELEAVGLQPDGSIVPINELEYAPDYGLGPIWWWTDPEFFGGLAEPKQRQLAQKSVYRWYRIKTPFRLPGVDDEIETLDRILPLENEQIESFETDHVEQARPPWVYGQFYPGCESHENTQEDAIEPRLEREPEGLYGGGFRLDAERGIVQFSEPVYRVTEVDVFDTVGYRIDPAEIRLRVSVNLREKETLGWIREEYERKPESKSPVADSKQYFLRDDVVRELIEDRGGGVARTIDNEAEAQAAADYYLDAIAAEYTPKDSATITYAGLLPIAPDGAIRQVTWSIADDGRATTRASRNREETHLAPSYQESRFLGRLQAAEVAGRVLKRQYAKITGRRAPR